MALKREKFKWGPFSAVAKRSLVESNAKINIWMGSVRAGKTISSIVRWIQYVQSVPATYALMMVGKTERTLKRNIIDVIIAILGTKNAVFKFGTGEFSMFGREIYVAGANDERSQEKIRGITLGGAYCDEITLYPESFFRMLSTRLSEPGAKLFGTTNPDSPYHWLKTEYIDNEDGDVVKTFHFTIDDNLTLEEEYKRQLKKEFTGLWYDRFILGKWVLAEGTVYDMWDDKKYVFDLKEWLRRRNKNGFKHYCIGVDYGTSNPTVFLLIGYDSFDGPYYVCKEYYYSAKGVLAKQKTDAEYANDLVEFAKDYRISHYVVDPSAASFKTELRRRGIITTDADNSVVDGIRFVSSKLNVDGLYVEQSCYSLKKEFTCYVWDEKKQEKGLDEPKKENDHALDALRYAIYTVFGQGMRGVIGGINRK